MPRSQPSLMRAVHWGRFTFWLSAGVVVMAGTIFAWHRTEEFLIQDDRFRIAPAEEFAGQSPNLIVEGVHYASPSQIRHVFAEDFGRSLYLVPIQERRKQVLEIDWVAEAAVSRIWPNTIKVRIRERVPVAFVHLSPNHNDGMSQFALIDKDGHILRPRMPAKFTLPVITGVRETESLADRRARVRRAMGLLAEVGPLAAQISEINVADPNNLIIAEHIGDRVVNLMVGDENYASRMKTFLDAYPTMNPQPDSVTWDLRLDGSIVALREERRGE